MICEWKSNARSSNVCSSQKIFQSIGHCLCIPQWNWICNLSLISFLIKSFHANDVIEKKIPSKASDFSLLLSIFDYGSEALLLSRSLEITSCLSHREIVFFLSSGTWEKTLPLQIGVKKSTLTGVFIIKLLIKCEHFVLKQLNRWVSEVSTQIIFMLLRRVFSRLLGDIARWRHVSWFANESIFWFEPLNHFDLRNSLSGNLEESSKSIYSHLAFKCYQKSAIK